MGNKQDKICAICLDPPTNPQIQSCGHEYCRKCLLDLIKYRKNYYFLLCPLCRQKMTSNERRWVLLSPLRRYQRKQPEISYRREKTKKYFSGSSSFYRGLFEKRD